MVKNKFKILSMFALCGFLTPFIGSAINLALPLIGQEFGMNIVSLGWVATIYLLSTAVFLVPFGRLADILGRKKLFIGGIITFTLSSLMCSFAYSGAFLLIARAIQGIGSAMIFGTSMALLVSIFPPKERGKAIGFQVSGVYVGSSLGPVLGGFLTFYFGWRYIFIVTTIIGAIVVYMGLKYLANEHGHAKGEKFDLKGSILYGIAVIAMLYGTSMLPAITGYLTIASGIALFSIFCFVEKKTLHPVFDVDLLFKNKKFAMSNIAALLNFSAAFAVPFLLSMYLQYVRGLQPNEAGVILLFSAVTMVFFSPVAGKFSDSFDQRTIASLGMAIAATTLLTASFIINQSTPFYVIALILFFFGLGLSLFATPNTHAAMESVTPRHLGIASSIIGTMRMFGQTLSMGITMLVFSLIIGKVKISSTVLPELMRSIHIILFVFGLLCICGMFASLARGKKSKELEEKI